MNTQTLTTEVVFRRPFLLGGLDGVQAPGIYRIETYSELLDIPSAIVYRRLSTSIELHNQPFGTIRTATIDPDELEEALRLDAASEAVVVPAAAGTVTDPRAATIPTASRRTAIEWHYHVAGGRERTSCWSQWLSLNATELTWIVLVFGGLLLMSVAR